MDEGGVVPPRPLSSHQITTIVPQEEAAENGGKSLIENEIKPCYFYEIDHIHLPSRTPSQLRSIRVAMVCEKTEMDIAVRYPSMESLRDFFNYSRRETLPALDKKFVMGMSLATKVLGRLVPEEVFSAQKSVEAFWMISSSASESSGDKVNVTHKKGTCLSENKESEENHGNAHNFSSSFVDRVEESHMKLAICHERESIEEAKKNGCSDIVEFNVMGGGDIENEEEEAGEEDEGNGDDDQENEGYEEEVEGEEKEEEEDDEDEEQEQEQEKAKKSGQTLKRKRYPFINNCAKKPKKQKQKQNSKKQEFNQTISIDEHQDTRSLIELERFKCLCTNKRDLVPMITQLKMEDEIKQFKRKLEGNASKKQEFNQTISVPPSLYYATLQLDQHFLSLWIGPKKNLDDTPLNTKSDILREYDLYKEWMKKTRPAGVPTPPPEPWIKTCKTDNDPKECNTSASQQPVIFSEVGEWLLLRPARPASDESSQG